MCPVELLGNAVLVTYEPLPPPENLSIEALRSLLRPPLNVSPTTDSLRVVSSRDQIEISISPIRVEVRDLSGEIDRAPERVPRIFDGVLGMLSPPTVLSYGMSFFLEIDLGGNEDAAKWLGRRFLKDDLAANLGGEASCDLIDVSFSQGSKLLNIEIQAIGEARVIVNFNANEATSTLPNGGDLTTKLVSQYSDLVELLKKIGFE